MLLMELLGDNITTGGVQVFATDLRETALNKARLGIFNKDEVADVLTRRLTKYFTRINGSHPILHTIRDLYNFSTHNDFKGSAIFKI
jgi:two-component system CheB/CheR fusion protein